MNLNLKKLEYLKMRMKMPKQIEVTDAMIEEYFGEELNELGVYLTGGIYLGGFTAYEMDHGDDTVELTYVGSLYSEGHNDGR